MSKKRQRKKRRAKRKPRRKKPVLVPIARGTFRVQVESVPAGYALNDCESGEEAKVLYRGFNSSEDGDLFISRLEGFPRLLLNLIRQQHEIPLFEGGINTMVAVVRKDHVAEVHVNPPCKAEMQWKGHRDVEPGEWIYANDISDVRQVVFENVVFPEDAGVVVVLSVGWRRAMFFDFGPLPPHLAPRDYDLGVLLGGYYSYLLFRNVFELSDQNWQLLLDQQWFPFVPLNRGTFDKIIEHAKKGKRIDDLLPEIRSDLDSVLPGQMKRWANTAAFEPHMAFIQKAYEQYLANDHISCLSILFPRIEGVLRTFQKLMGDPTRANQRDLADVVVSDGVNPRHPVYSPLLPIWFNRYLAECYFAHFDPKAESHSLSRNTVGHGVAGADVFNEKGCVLGFLVLCQLGLYFGGVEGTQHE